VEGSCEFDDEPSGFIKCWKVLSGNTSGGGPSNGAHLHRVG
jgi:hypothetical protein